MNKALLEINVQEFISKNLNVSLSKLALLKNPFPELEWISILEQISAKKKAQDKLPTWFIAKDIYYPSKISVEQTSSEITALYKSSIVTGNSLIDLTGGFGVDDFYFSKKMKVVAHCEINPELSDIVKHNFKQLKAETITCYTGDSTTILQHLNKKWDWVYLDPSRRSDTKGKVFLLRDCLPNVPENLDFYLSFTANILIKTAPLLDLKAGISELKFVKSIHIIAVDNEVKELLWEIEKSYTGEIEIKTINKTKETQQFFDFKLDQKTQTTCYELPQTYLYEPNSAIMKSGGFEPIAVHYQLHKIHKHSHLYTSENLIDFPGRVFKIEKTVHYTKKEMRYFNENPKANVTIRNFPETVEKIRKKWKIIEGGNSYCFFTTDRNDNKIVLICSKIK